MELNPISASLGAMGSLPRKLNELLATRHWALRGAVMDEVEQLTTHIHILHNFLVKLSNAQDPPMTARYWMKDVRELSYDMVDCADQFVHAHDRAKIRRVTCRKTITRLKVNRLPERWKWRPWITNKVSEFRARAQEAIQRYRRYKFHGCPSNPGYSRVGRELPTMSDPGDLVGIEGPMNELDQLLGNGGEQLKVVSIVGAGGIGKTTLAQKLFAKLHGQFECRAFVRTAEKPDMRGILRNIFLQVRPHQPPDCGEMHHLIHDLRKYLQDKRYFIIIDDLWATSVWDVVSRAFPEGDCCSRIITTTAIMEVALACSGFSPEHIFKMESLSDDDSEKLLLKRILVSGNRSPQQFNDVLPQIKKNCDGLPLAIIIVASILARQPEKLEQWGCLQNSYGSSFGANLTMEGFIGQILTISFNGLPRYLKTCLLHLSTYPEGCQFLKDDLVKQWVAEGFICANKEEDMEEVAESYFDELVSMGLIQVMDINYDSELSYSVHHVILDFITCKSIEENFITVVDYSQTTTPHADKVRRQSLPFGSATYATTPASTRLSQVRSLFFSGLFNCMPSFMEFKLLRVIILHFWGDTGNMSLNLAGICELFRLRYLKVTSNVTTKLPDQIKGMKCLESLEISGGLCDVPPDIVRLSGLLHLRLRGGTNLRDGIGCMRSLRTLMYFDLGNSSEDNIRGLGELTNLWHLHLTYSSSPSSEHVKRNLVALASALGKLCNLRSLTLAAGTAGTVVLFDGSGGMSIPVSLERLELLPPICIFSRIPEWIGDLRKLCIMKVAVRELLINDIDILTGLPSLTVLSLQVQTVPEGMTIFRGGAFPVLKYFKFSCAVLCMSFMPGAMPNLRTLELRFNTHLREKYSNMLAGSEYLINLQDITGQIGAATESYLRTAESAIKDAISKHPRCPRLNVQWADPVEEEYCHSQKQHGKQEKGQSDEVLEKTNEMNEHANSGYSVPSDQPSTATSPRLETGTRAEKSASALSKVCIQDGNVSSSALSKVVVAKKAVGDLGFLLRQLSLDQFQNESRRMHPANNNQSYSSKKALRTPQGFSHKRVISLLLTPRNWKPPVDRTFFLDSYEVGELCYAAEQIFIQEPTVLQLKAPVKVFGNLHGQFGDLMCLFDEYGYPSIAGDITYIDYLFLGDYVDQGQHSLEPITLLLALKIGYPEHIHLIRGNHEAADINGLFGFRLECIERMAGESDGIWAWTRFNQLFNYLPLAAMIDKKIICMHGGIGRSINSVEQIEKIERPITMDVGSIILMDLLWSDPTENDTVQGLRPNARGPGLVTFGPDRVTEFCKRNKLQLIIRSHECVMDGFEHFAHGQLTTLFSATNYCGTARNIGAILVVGRELVIVPKLIYPLPPPVNSPESSPERSMDTTWMQELNIQRPPTPTRGRTHYAGDRKYLAYI